MAQTPLRLKIGLDRGDDDVFEMFKGLELQRFLQLADEAERGDIEALFFAPIVAEWLIESARSFYESSEPSHLLETATFAGLEIPQRERGGRLRGRGGGRGVCSAVSGTAGCTGAGG